MEVDEKFSIPAFFEKNIINYPTLAIQEEDVICFRKLSYYIFSKLTIILCCLNVSRNTFLFQFMTC